MLRFLLSFTALLIACGANPPADAPIDAAPTDIAVDTNEGPDACWLAIMRGTPRPCTCSDGRAGMLQGCDPPGCFCTGDAGADAAADVATDGGIDATRGDASDATDPIDCPPSGSACLCDDGGIGRTLGGCDPPGCDCRVAGADASPAG